MLHITRSTLHKLGTYRIRAPCRGAFTPPLNEFVPPRLLECILLVAHGYASPPTLWEVSVCTPYPQLLYTAQHDWDIIYFLAILCLSACASVTAHCRLHNFIAIVIHSYNWVQTCSSLLINHGMISRELRQSTGTLSIVLPLPYFVKGRVVLIANSSLTCKS